MSKAFEDLRDLEVYGYTPEQAIELLKLVELRKISSELVDMNTALINIQRPAEALEGCVSKSDHGSFFCTTGNVTNYEG